MELELRLLQCSCRYLSIRVTADYDEYDEICCAVGSTSLWNWQMLLPPLFGGQIISKYLKSFSLISFKSISDDNSGIIMYILKNLENIKLKYYLR